ncbi:hypothetical protein ScPMuIL_005941 [Solemya velum]
MKEDDWRKIENNYKYLVDNVNLHELQDAMISSGIIDVEDGQRIRQEVTDKDKVRKLLDVVRCSRTGSETFVLFCKNLDETGQHHISNTLRNAKLEPVDKDSQVDCDNAAVRSAVVAHFEIAEGTIPVSEVHSVILQELRKKPEKAVLSRWNEDLTTETIKKIFSSVVVQYPSPSKDRRSKSTFNGLWWKEADENKEETDEKAETAVDDSQLSAVRTPNLEDDGVPFLKSLRTDELCELLGPVLEGKDIDRSYVLEIIEEQKIDGEVYHHLGQEQIDRLFPKLKFGERVNMFLSKTKICPSAKDIKSVVPINKQTFSSTSFRKFDTSSKPSDKYKFGSLMPETETRPHDFIRPLHRYCLPVESNEDELLNTIAIETVKFASACMNERSNATIHFGIADEQTRDHRNGEVLGLHIPREKIDGVITETIRHMFYTEQLSTALCSIRPPQVVEVTGTTDESNVRFVVEIDVVPSSGVVSDDAFFIKDLSSSTSGSKFQILRYKNGKAEELNAVETQKYMKEKTDLTARRKSQEVPQRIVHERPGQELVDFFCQGSKVLEESLFPFLFLSPSDGDFLSNHFKFLKNVSWRVIFDFDPNSCSSGLYNLMENRENKVFKVMTLGQFPGENEDQEFFDDIKIASTGPWVFCNGYQPTDEKELDALKWNRQRNSCFRRILNFYEKEIPSDRARFLFFVLSHNFEVFIEAATEVLRLFENQWLVIAETESLVETVRVKLFSRNVADMDTLKCKCITLPWLHVTEAMDKIAVQKNVNQVQIPVSSGTFVTVPETVKLDLSDLDILGATECESDHSLPPQSQMHNHRRTMEMKFYRGEEVSWWNFMYDQVLQRSEHNRIKTLVQETLDGDIDSEDANIGQVTIFHHPGAGGTTTAKNILWDLREMYRCCKINRITKNTCQQIRIFRSFKDEDNPKPPLILIDNEDLEKLSSLYKSLREESLESRHPVFCVLLMCSRRAVLPFDLPRKRIMLKHELTPQELYWFKEKDKQMQTNYQRKGIDPKVLISFNIMKNNFSHDSIERTVSEFVNSIPEKELELLKTIALINTFDLKFSQIPVPCFDPLMGHRDPRTGRFRADGWNQRLGQSIRVLLNETPRASLGGMVTALRIVNPLLSAEILQVICKKQENETLGEAAKSFIHSVIFEPRNESSQVLQQIIKNIVKNREWKIQDGTAKKKYLSPLLSKLVELGDVDSAEIFVTAVFEMTKDPMIAQQLARLYMSLEMWEKAIEYADKATKISPHNSFLWHTHGEIYKTQLLKIYQRCEKSGETLPNDKAMPVFHLVSKSIEMFQVVQKLSLQQEYNVNPFGHSGQIEVTLILLDILRLIPKFQSIQVLGRCLMSTEESIEFYQPDIWKRIQGFYGSAYAILEFLEMNLYQKVNNTITESKSVLALKNSDKLIKFKAELGAYFDDSFIEDTKQLTQEQKCEVRRQKLKKIGGTSLLSILKMQDDEDGEDKLRTQYHLMKENVESDHRNPSDLRRLISCTLALQGFFLTSWMQMDVSDVDLVLQWSRHLYNSSSKEKVADKEACLLYVILHWPAPAKQGLGIKHESSLPILIQALEQLKKSVDKSSSRHKLSTRALFYLAKDMGKYLNWLIYFKKLVNMSSKQEQKKNPYRSNFAVSKLQRLDGTLINNGREVTFYFTSLHDNKGPPIQIRLCKPLTYRPALNNKKVYFLLGFTLDGPLAYDVDDKLPEVNPQEPVSQRPKKTRQKRNFGPIQNYDILIPLRHELQQLACQGPHHPNYQQIEERKRFLIDEITRIHQERQAFFEENM